MDETLIRALVTIVTLGGSAAGMAWTIISWVRREGQDTDGEWADTRGTEVYGTEGRGHPDEVEEELATRRRAVRYAREHADWDARLARATWEQEGDTMLGAMARGPTRGWKLRRSTPERRPNPRLSNRRTT